MNERVNKSLFVGNKFIPEMHLQLTEELQKRIIRQFEINYYFGIENNDKDPKFLF